MVETEVREEIKEFMDNIHAKYKNWFECKVEKIPDLVTLQPMKNAHPTITIPGLPHTGFVMPIFKWSDYTNAGKPVPMSNNTNHNGALNISIQFRSEFPSSHLRHRHLNDCSLKWIHHEVYIPDEYKYLQNPPLAWDKVWKGCIEFHKKCEDMIWEIVLPTLEEIDVSKHVLIEFATKLRKYCKAEPPYEVHTSYPNPTHNNMFNFVFNPWVGRDRLLMFANEPKTFEIWGNSEIIKSWMNSRINKMVHQYSWDCSPVIIRPTCMLLGKFDPDTVVI